MSRANGPDLDRPFGERQVFFVAEGRAINKHRVEAEADGVLPLSLASEESKESKTSARQARPRILLMIG